MTTVEGAPGSVRRDEADGIITVTFTRDEKLNAVNASMLDVLTEAVRDLGDREEARALIIAAEGRYFTAGRDIANLVGRPESGVALRRDYRILHDLFDEIEEIEKPTVLAVQGPCLGVGVELGASCDFRFASERASFSLPELPNLAVLPGSGGVSRLTRLVGPHWARWMAMAGETVDAELALTMGFVHRVLPEAGFHEAVQAWVAKLVGSSPEALGLAKLTIDAVTGADRRTARDIDRIANTQLFKLPEHIDRVNSFLNSSRR